MKQMKTNKWEFEDEWIEWIGYTVTKHSGKPFKGGDKIGIVVDMDVNPHSKKPAFLIDDGSLVDCYQCKLYDSVKYTPPQCVGERCIICGEQAKHKVAEVILSDDPLQGRHELTAYVCTNDFRKIFGGK